jgi:DNA polymerase V
MPRGGARKNAGRPKGLGKHGERTKPIRIPESMIEEVMEWVQHKGFKLPIYSSKVQAGFPSPGDDHMEAKLDLNDHLVKHPAATFFVRVAGDSMINAGIHSGDILIVDRSLSPDNHKIVIAAIDGELTVKRLEKRRTATFLMPENPDYTPIPITEESNVTIWGVVTNVIHPV